MLVGPSTIFRKWPYYEYHLHKVQARFALPDSFAAEVKSCDDISTNQIQPHEKLIWKTGSGWKEWKCCPGIHIMDMAFSGEGSTALSLLCTLEVLSTAPSCLQLRAQQKKQLIYLMRGGLKTWRMLTLKIFITGKDALP